MGYAPILRLADPFEATKEKETKNCKTMSTCIDLHKFKHYSNFLNMKGEIILYQTENGQTKIEVILDNENVWLNQYQMEELFQTD